MEDSFVLFKTLPVIDPTGPAANLIHFESEIVLRFVSQIFSKLYGTFCTIEPQICIKIGRRKMF